MLTSPAQRLMSRCTQDLLPVPPVSLRPTITGEDELTAISRKQEKERERFGKRKALPALEIGDTVWVKPNKLGEKEWKKGIVEAKRKEPQSYDVRLDNGGQIRRNRQDLKRVSKNPAEVFDPECFDDSESDSDAEIFEKSDHDPQTLQLEKMPL